MKYLQKVGMRGGCSDYMAAELQKATLVCRPRGCESEVYSFDGRECQALMSEVWRLRDRAFGGVGVKLDDAKAGERGDVDGTYRQLIVWDAARRCIVGGYRYAIGRSVAAGRLSLSRYFSLSERFVEEYLPRGVELGRTFVAAEHQAGTMRSAIYALSDLWQGLSCIVRRCRVRYLFGRVTLYPELGVRARNLLLGFMRYGYPSREPLMMALKPLNWGISRRSFRRLFVGATATENYKILIGRMRSMGRNIPPVISSYMRLSPSMQSFGSYINEDLGGVAEVAIMLDSEEFYDDVKRRYCICQYSNI